MEESKEDGRKFSEIVLCTVTAIMIIFSLVGNFLVCLAFYRNRRLRSITNFYVLSLAIADITFAIFVSPFNVIAIGYRRWPFDFNFCQFNGFLSAYWTEVSIFILTMTSINRYVCVVKLRLYLVFFSKRKTVLSILFIFIVMFISSLTFVIITPVIYRWDPQGLHCRGTYLKRTRTTKTTLAGLVLLSLLLIVFCYGSVHRVVSHHHKALQPSLHLTSNRGTITAQEIKTCRLLFAAVAVRVLYRLDPKCDRCNS
ncbi:unnamed protein product [Porites evermanni]|uniref:G-protein coupled receptors family 1 profile domain-containing protein n=1 Tax=Porites evermanni TaxID=104178 RepID=A0ABN8SFT9_9CNID|nr:unnamed protein product [Porites evermanni]